MTVHVGRALIVETPPQWVNAWRRRMGAELVGLGTAGAADRYKGRRL